MRKINYAELCTRRADGRYQKKYNGKSVYDRDPEACYHKWQRLVDAENGGKSVSSFKEAAAAWEEKHRDDIGERTWKNYKPHYDDLVEMFGSKCVDEITAQDIIDDLQKAKAKNLSATVVKTRKTIMTQILNQALADGNIKFNPAMSVKLPKNLKRGKRKAPTKEEMDIVANSIDAPFGFFAYFLLLTGLRKGEALALKTSDIDLKQKTILVTKSVEYIDNANPSLKEPKTESGYRVVPIVLPLYQELVKYMSSLEGEILFPSPKSNRNSGGGHMTQKAYEVAWKKYQDATGLTLTAHQLRHGAATILYEAGVDTYTTKTILGHANVTTTMEIYTELRAKKYASGLKKFEKEAAKYKPKVSMEASKVSKPA